MKRKPTLPAAVIEDRLRRYFTDEPIRLIAADHNCTLETIIKTAYRHAPWMVGVRKRGGTRREWNPDAS